MDIQNLVTLLLGLAGFGALVSALVNVGKAAGVVKDGTAGAWVTGANLLGVAALFLLDVFGVPFDLERADEVMGLVAQLLVLAGQLFVALGGSDLFYRLTGGKVPLIGKSFSAGGA